MTVDIIDTLKNLGFTEYEAKAYLALLNSSPMTGYAVAKNSGVPRAKIYEVLESLTARGDIIISPGNTPLYRPVPAKELVANRKAEAEQNFLLAEQSLMQFNKSASDRDNIWNITGYEAILQKVCECIVSAKHRILLEIWAEDFPKLEKLLDSASKKGVSITIVSYGEIKANFASVHRHDLSEEITDEYGGRWIVLSTDDREVVAGILSPNDKSRAAWTMHPGLVMPITEVIIHDLYIMEILYEYRDELEKRFGKNLIDLRHKYTIHPDNKKHYI